MKQQLINKMFELRPTKRQILFAGLELFCNQVHLPRHKNVDLSLYCIESKKELKNRYGFTSNEISQLYKYVKDNINNSNTYKKFRAEYLE